MFLKSYIIVIKTQRRGMPFAVTVAKAILFIECAEHNSIYV